MSGHDGARGSGARALSAPRASGANEGKLSGGPYLTVVRAPEWGPVLRRRRCTGRCPRARGTGRCCRSTSGSPLQRVACTPAPPCPSPREWHGSGRPLGPALPRPQTPEGVVRQPLCAITPTHPHGPCTCLRGPAQRMHLASKRIHQKCLADHLKFGWASHVCQTAARRRTLAGAVPRQELHPLFDCSPLGPFGNADGIDAQSAPFGLRVCVCACACARVCSRACARAHVCVCV